MRTIIAGSRSIADYQCVVAAINQSGFAPQITEVVSGCASGVDRLGERWAKESGKPVKRFPALWEKHGRSAGMIRNRDMANNADALIAVHDGKSRGTQNMIDLARKVGLRVFVKFVMTGRPIPDSFWRRSTRA